MKPHVRAVLDYLRVRNGATAHDVRRIVLRPVGHESETYRILNALELVGLVRRQHLTTGPRPMYVWHAVEGATL